MVILFRIIGQSSRIFKLIIIVASDVDLCQECYDKDPAEHEIEGHRFGHDTVLTATYLQESRRLWIYYQNEREAERCYAKIQEIQAPKPPTKPDDDTWGSVCSDDDDDPHGIKEDDVRKKEDAIPVDIRQETVLYSCFVCQAYITLESGFFICGEYSCRSESTALLLTGLSLTDHDVHQWDALFAGNAHFNNTTMWTRTSGGTLSFHLIYGCFV